MSTSAATSMEFSGERVKRIRVHLRLSQVEFAQKLGVDANMVSKWETGQAAPKIGRVLGALLDAEREAFGG